MHGRGLSNEEKEMLNDLHKNYSLKEHIILVKRNKGIREYYIYHEKENKRRILKRTSGEKLRNCAAGTL